MRQHRLTKRLLASLAGVALLAAACGDDDDDEDVTTDEGEDEEAEPGDEVERATDRLVLGRIAPESGPLGFLGPPQIEGAALALEDINAAGGVLGQDVEMLLGDEGETEDTTREAAERLLGEGANAFIGAASSARSFSFLQLLFDEQIPQCSGSNTSPDFTAAHDDNAGFYFRTVPGDDAVAPVIADQVIADGHSNVAIVNLGDEYGNPLADLVEQNLTDQGATVSVKTSYAADATSFDDQIEAVVGESPDAVVVISFDEGFPLIAGLVERGISGDQMYGADGIFFPTLPENIDPTDENVIDGMTLIGAAGDEEFNARIAGATENNFIYGGQVYDCVVTMALAAEKAGSVTGPDIIAEIQNVTGGDGEKCTTFADCKALLEAGEEIDYDGASGGIALSETGDPTEVRYAIGRFEDGTFSIVDAAEVNL